MSVNVAFNPLNKSDFLTDQSLAGSFQSNAIPIQFQDNISLQLIWTGTPTGIFGIQASINHKQDNLGNVQIVGNWVDLPIDPVITASGSGDSAIFDLNQLPYNYIRLIYIYSSGDGSLNVFIGAKGI